MHTGLITEEIHIKDDATPEEINLAIEKFYQTLPTQYRIILEKDNSVGYEFEVIISELIQDLVKNSISPFVQKHPEVLQSNANEIRNILDNLFIYFTNLDHNVLGNYSRDSTGRKFIKIDLKQIFENYSHQINTSDDLIKYIDKTWRHEVVHLLQDNFAIENDSNADYYKKLFAISSIIFVSTWGLTFSGDLESAVGLTSISSLIAIYSLFYSQYCMSYWERESSKQNKIDRKVEEIPFKAQSYEP